MSKAHGASAGAIGRAARHILLDERGWTSRHVEHLELIDDVFTRRRVTFDVRLPVRGGDLGKLGELRLYVVPVAAMRKDRPVAGVDLRDEQAAALPLLTLDENAELTAAALIATARAMARRPVPREIAENLRTIAVAEPGQASRAYHRAASTEAARRFTSRVLRHPGASRFDRFVFRATSHSVLWIPLTGLPGQRRLVKLAYEEPVGAHELRGRVRFGLASLELWLFTPYLPETGSYHLEIDTPVGLEMRKIEAVGTLEQRPGERAVFYKERSSRGAHLYANGLRGRGEMAVAFALRIGRRGYLTSAFMACSLIAALLVPFATRTTALASKPQVSGGPPC